MKLYYKIKQLVSHLASYRIPLYAANASFYIFLSAFPAIMLVVGILPHIGYTSDTLLRAMGSVLPEVLMPLVERVVRDMSANSSGTLLSVTAITALWSASRGVYCIQLGLNAIHGVRESRNYFFQRFLCILYTLFLIAALILTLVIHGFGQELAGYLQRQDVPILRFFAKLLQFRGLILFLLLTVLFTAMFCVLPNRKLSVRRSVPGAALAALGWLLFTMFFTVYVRFSGSYSLLYGSLSSIAIGMLWLYICISILFYGCVINLLADRRRTEHNS